MQWTDEGIVLGVRRHGEAKRHRRADDARAWPPSRPGARRRGLAHAPDPAAGQQRARDLAGAARRASRQLRARGHCGCAPAVSRGLAWRLWADASGGAARGCCRSAIRIRDVYEVLEAMLERLDDAAAGRAAGGAVRAAAAGRTRLRPRSRAMRGDRRAPTISSMSRRNRAGRCRARPASPGTTGCCALPAFLTAQDEEKPSATRRRRRLRDHRLLSRPACARAARARDAGSAATIHRRGPAQRCPSAT